MDARMKAILILRRSASLGESQVEEREGRGLETGKPGDNKTSDFFDGNC